MIQYIIQHLVDEDDHDRMKAIGYKGVADLNYYDFIQWNISCLEKLSTEEQAWVLVLCKKISECTIGMMDMECCSIWKAYGFYYDTDRNLCIVHPR
jgi:hypothetical protein